MTSALNLPRSSPDRAPPPGNGAGRGSVAPSRSIRLSKRLADPQMTLRRATADDAAALRAMHRASLRDLGRQHYIEQQIEGFLQDFDTADSDMLADGTVLLIVSGETIVASGGWTLRQPSYATRDPIAADLPAMSRRATIRGVFVRPGFTRRGLASAVMGACEDEAIRHGGATDIELYATLPGVPLYLRLGYVPQRPVEIPLSNGEVFQARLMSKRTLAGDELA